MSADATRMAPGIVARMEALAGALGRPSGFDAAGPDSPMTMSVEIDGFVLDLAHVPDAAPGAVRVRCALGAAPEDAATLRRLLETSHVLLDAGVGALSIDDATEEFSLGVHVDLDECPTGELVEVLDLLARLARGGLLPEAGPTGAGPQVVQAPPASEPQSVASTDTGDRDLERPRRQTVRRFTRSGMVRLMAELSSDFDVSIDERSSLSGPFTCHVKLPTGRAHVTHPRIDADRVLLRIDFGSVPRHRTGEALRRLLTLNDSVTSRDAGFGIDGDAGTIVYFESVALQESASLAPLLQLLDHQVAQWRENWPAAAMEVAACLA